MTIMMLVSKVALLVAAASGLEVSRRGLVQKGVGFAASVAGASQAVAYKGIYGMDVVSAKDAVKDSEALSSAAVKSAIDDLRAMSGSVKKMAEGLKGDAQFDVAKVVKAELPVTKVRTTFNSLATVFDEDTQKGTDRLARGLLQDLLEVQTQAQLVPGKERSAKKNALVAEKLTKLQSALDELDAYFL